MKKSTKYFLKSIIFVVAITAMANMAAGQTNQSICLGQSATLTATGGIHYLWSTGDTTASTVVTPTSTTQYWVTVTQSGNTSLDSVTVTVHPLPTASAGNDTSFCVGSVASLTATGGTHYLWSTGDTTATILGSSRNPGTKTFTVTVTNAYGCSANASVKVTVNSLPIANIIPIGNVINEGRDTVFYSVGSYVCLVATGGTNYRWSTGDSTEFVSALVTQPISGIPVTVTVTNDYGCSASDSIVVTVKNNYQKVYNICSGQSLALHVLLGSGNPFLWSTGDSTDNINVSPDSSTTYFVTVTWSDNSLGVDSFKVNVKPEPIINIVADTISPGPGLPVTLTATGGTNMKYRWGKNTYGAVTTVFPANTTTYMVQGSDMYGCKGGGQVTITVNNNSIPAQSVYNICPGQTAQLTAPKGSSYSWSTGDSTATIIVFPPDSANKYFVTVTQPNSTSVIDSFMVNIKPEPVVSAGPNIASPAAGSPVTLTASGGTNMRYYWSNGAIGNDISVSPLVSTTYVVTAYDLKSGCTAASPVNVNVKVNNNATAPQFKYNICRGQSVALTVPNKTDEINVSALLNGALSNMSYVWSTGDSTETIIVSPDSTKTYFVTVTLSDNTNVIDTFKVHIKPNPIVSAGPDITSPGVGAPITLTATGGMRYYWSNGIGGNVISVSPVVTTIYTVTAYAKNGCSAAANVTVTVNDINSSSIFIGQDSTGRSIISTIPDSTLYIQSARTASTDTARNTIINSNNAGRVGIGTNNPTEKLSVVGNASFSGNITFGGAQTISYLPPSNGNPGLTSFGYIHPILFSPCSIPNVTIPNVSYSPQQYSFLGMLYSYGSNINQTGVMQMGFDGSNGIIDIAIGTSNRPSPSTLWLGYYCGANVVVGQYNGNNGTFTTLNSAYLATNGGNVGIGTTNPAYLLDVNGIIKAQEVKVCVSGCDFVFDKNYELLSLSERKNIVLKQKHLLNVASSGEMQEGASLGETTMGILQNVEEHEQYLYQHDERIEKLEQENAQMKAEIEFLKTEIEANQKK